MKALSKKAVTLEILKSKSHDIESQDEAEIIISLLENVTGDYEYKIHCLTAPETNVLKKVAIIRTTDMSINLVNPVILEKGNKIISFKEPCASFNNQTYNCFRHENITIQNGLQKEKIILKGHPAVLVQHAIDHFDGLLYHERRIKLAVARIGGKILDNDPCPCASKKRFNVCCMK